MATVTGSDGSLNTGTPACSPRIRSCSTAAGRWRSAPTSSGLRPSLRLYQRGQLGRGGGLAGSLQAGQQHDRRRAGGVGEPEGLAAEDGAQLVVDDLDDLLARGQALGEVDPDQLLPDPRHEVADDPKVDVGLQQGQADLAQGLVDVGFAQPAPAAQPAEDGVEAVGQGLEHGGLEHSVDDPLRLARLARKSPASAEAMG